MAEAVTTDFDEHLAEERLMRLREARINLVHAKKYVAKLAAGVVSKLNSEIARGHENVPFMIATFFAIAKDFFLDYIAPILSKFVSGAISIAFLKILGSGVVMGPAIEAMTMIIIGLVKLFITLTLLYFLWNKINWGNRLYVRIILFIFMLFEIVPGFSKLPMATIDILYAWHLVRKRAHAAEKKLRELPKLTKEEIEKINDNIDLIDGEE